jgi:hypothetical protein
MEQHDSPPTTQVNKLTVGNKAEVNEVAGQDTLATPTPNVDNVDASTPVESKSSRHWQMGWEALTGIGTIFLGFVTLGVMAVTYIAVRTDSEDRLLPIVVLGYDSHAANLVVENIGFGPALNSKDIDLRQGNIALRIYHVSALRPRQPESVGMSRIDGNEKPVPIMTPLEIETQLKRLFPEVTRWPGKDVCVAYANANGEWYETRQAIRLSSASEPALQGMAGIIIEYKGRKKVGEERKTCQ